MIYGKTEAETIQLNGWKEGDILEGVEGKRTDQIKITRIGEETFLCRWKYQEDKEFRHETGSTTLTCRDWKKVADDYNVLCDGCAMSFHISKVKEFSFLNAMYHACSDQCRKNIEE